MLRLTLILLFIALALLVVVKKSAQSSTALVRLTNTSEQALNLNPILSDDGSVVVFESTSDLAGTGAGNGFHLLRFNTQKFSGFEEIARSRASAVTLSTDGQEIAFASTEDLVGQNADRNSEIYFFDGTLKQLTHTSPRSELTRLTDGNFEPSLSGDGHMVAFSSNRTEITSDILEILLVDTASNTVTQLTTSPLGTTSTQPKVTVDGSRVYFIRQKPGSTNADLMLINISERSTRLLANDISELSLTTGRALSSDGNRIVYSASIGLDQTQVFLFDLRSDAIQQLTKLGTRTTDVPLNPTISGDGRRVTFATRRRVVNPSDGGVELYLLDLPTGKIDQITTAPSSATAEVLSSISHDGSTAVFNFPRLFSGPVNDPDLANNSEIYEALLPQRPEFGEATIANAATRDFSQHRIAPDSIAIIKGNHLCNIEQEAKLIDGKLPFVIGGTTVQGNGEFCQLLFASSTEVIFVTPSNLPDGPVRFIVTNSEAFPSKAETTVARSAPGIFTDGSQAVVLNSDTFVSDPFDPTDGQLRLTIFATGVRHASQLSATVNGEAATVEAVAASTLPGLDEIHARLPSELRGAGVVSIAIKAGELEANLVSTTLSGSSIRDVMINEVLADPPDGIAGDANRDGTRDSAADEFVELVNSTARDLDLTGYQIQTRAANSSNDTVRHRFAAGTLLPAGTAIVVFGGGALNSTNSSFGGAQIVRASSGGLSLNNSGGVITLRDTAGAVVSSVSYGTSAGIAGDANQSITRAPDVTGSLVLHQVAPDSQAHAFSPGVKVNGSPFLPEPAVSVIQVSPTTGQILTGAHLQFSAHAFDRQGHELSDVIFRWNSSNPATLTIDSTGIARALSGGLAEITALARGVKSAPVTINVIAPTPTLIPSPSPSPTPSASPSPTASASPTPSPSPVTVPAVVISEFRTRGPNGASDEFIEIYNKSDSAVNLSGLKIRGSSNAGTITTRLTITSNTFIPGRGHFLAVNSTGYSGSVPGEQSFTSGIANDGGVALTMADDTIIDQVGLSVGSAFKEGTNLPPLTTDSNQSYERKPGGASGSTLDTQNNLSDFQLLTSSDPQNTMSPPTPGVTPSPTPIPTPSPTPLPSPLPTPSPSPSPSPTPIAMPQIVISQIYGGGGNSGAPFRNDFIELFNSGSTAQSLAGLTVQYGGATATTWSVTSLPSVVLSPGQYFLIQEASGGTNGTLLP
ncbi:MAG TPA: lamin tail domain-containing protein, partial [Pyrinomonadaceae bacterium]|nr:lamin tail domain-containing protein [Pyrinomonadaceae bacterium]